MAATLNYDERMLQYHSKLIDPSGYYDSKCITAAPLSPPWTELVTITVLECIRNGRSLGAAARILRGGYPHFTVFTLQPRTKTCEYIWPGKVVAFALVYSKQHGAKVMSFFSFCIDKCAISRIKFLRWAFAAPSSWTIHAAYVFKWRS